MFLVLAVVLFTTVVVLAIREQLRFQTLRRGMPGPRWVLPFIGNLIPVARDPYEFFRKLFAQGHRVSWNSFLGKFFILTNDVAITKRVLKEQGTKFALYLSDSAKYVLGPDNIGSLHKANHSFFQKLVVPIFSRKNWTSYLPVVEKNVRRHLSLWIDECKQNDTVVVSSKCHDMLISITMETFLGSQHRKRLPDFKEKLAVYSRGMFCLPVYFPGTTLWRAVKARKSLTADLKPAVREAVDRVDRDGGASSSFLDQWVKSLMDGRLEMSDIVRLTCENIPSLLFASQDTTTATLTQFFALMSSHPNVLAKLRDEQRRLRPNDEPITAATLDQMTYAAQVFKEVLRFNGPVFFLTVTALCDTEIDGVFIPKDAIVAANMRKALHSDGFADPHMFNPERFGPERREYVSNAKHYLPFGVGAHRCLGNHFAEFLVVVTAALAASNTEWRRISTEKGDDKMTIENAAILADGCVISMKERSEAK